MSQTLEAPQSPAASPTFTPNPIGDGIERELLDFSYRPVPILAIVGLVVGILAVTAFLGIVGICLALLGLISSLAATLRIAFDRVNYGGLKIAISGLILSTAFFAGGVYNQIDLYRRELPAGFKRISFRDDISAYRFEIHDGAYELAPDVAALEGKPIFFKAWIFPMGDENPTRGLTQFLVVKDNGLCCFGKNPDPWDSIIVALDPETFPEGIDYTTSMVSIGGTLEIIRDENGQMYSLYNNVTPYRVQAAYFDKSWTMF